MSNPLFSEREIRFVLHEVEEVETLCRLGPLSAHSKETIDLYVDACRRLAREHLHPAYEVMDAEPGYLRDGRVKAHAAMHAIFPKLVELGVIAATRPESVGGQSLPVLAATIAHAHLMAANLSAYAYLGLTSGAARLIESFGSSELREKFMEKMYAGEWTGTMALTEPQAGSSLADVATSARPLGDGSYSIHGSKVFISGGDQDLTKNIVHLTLARIDGAPPGVKGISLFAIPKMRESGGEMISNDVTITGVFKKMGWRGLPSVALTFGERDDCRGWLVGEASCGLAYMFQMMNEARIMVGANGVATASVAYHESVEYAKTRAQGRPAGAKNPLAPQVPIIDHADVRRMLIKQKAIVEGGLLLLAFTAKQADLAEHAEGPEERRRAKLLLDLLTPIAKSFPAERGFESNALAVQIHGGYGYTGEFRPEGWLRDQKLNSIHEGTTGIQSLDLLGRKIPQEGGAALELLGAEVGRTIARAKAAGVDREDLGRLANAAATVERTARALLLLGRDRGPDAMLVHSAEFLELASNFAVGWRWLEAIAVASEKPADGFYETKIATGRYWLRAELPRVEILAAECLRADPEYLAIGRDSW
jgi:butyryl-CoA dehydrogenase